MEEIVRKELCPKCSHTRGKGRNEKCLRVFESGNKYCQHCGYNSASDGEKPVRQIKKLSQKLPSLTSDEVQQYFLSRNITPAAIQRNQVCWNGKEILFPYFLDGEILNIKYRGLDKRFRQEAGATKLFYGLDDIRGEKDVYIVEGEIDKLSCEVAGFENVVSVPDGAPSVDAKTYNTKFQFIDDYYHLFTDTERIIIAVDSDGPGKKLEAELIRRFGPERCWLVEWPDGCKDANDVLQKHDMIGLMTCLENPAQIPIEGLYSIEDYYTKITTLYDEGLKGGASTGWLHMDNNYTVRPGEMTIVTGMPSHGKSTWLTALLVNLASEHEWKAGLYSPENQPLERYAGVIAAMKLDKPFKEGYTDRMTMEELNEALFWMNDRFYFLLPNEDELGIKDLLVKAKSAVGRHGINGFVLDPWNEIDHSRPRGMTETEHISSALTEIRRFARMYRVHVWIVAHPVKMIKLPGKETYPVPTAYDISGSAHWYNKADNILSVWRDIRNENREVEVHVQKIRFREVGKAGEVKFHHNPATGKYSMS